MFEYIKGVVTALKPSHIILEANSVGYFAAISLNTYTQLNGKETVKLFVHQVIREDCDGTVRPYTVKFDQTSPELVKKYVDTPF